MHLYVHVPFCARRCSYCDFSIAVRRTVPTTEYLECLEQELVVRDLGGTALSTVYLGGGTPSRLGAEGVGPLLETVRERFGLRPDAEVTLEANPDDVHPSAARAWREAGVNRISLGVQSFHPPVLEWMHRTHTAQQATDAVHVLRDAGFTNLSLDLIFALPAALERDWRADLDAAVRLDPEHVSVYGLTVEPATPLGRWTARGEVREAPDDRWAEEFLLAHDHLVATGFEHYEVSSYARFGRRSRHNTAYWTDRPYVGVGPSAHGFDGRTRRWNESAYARWVARLRAGEDPCDGTETLTSFEREAERVYLGLRTDAGLRLGGGPPDRALEFERAGWGTISEPHGQRVLTLNPAGWLRLDSIAAALTDVGSHY